MFAAGVWLYCQTTYARDRIGRYALAAYVGVLLAVYALDRLGGAPPSVNAIAWSGIALIVVFIPWAWWLDRHRGLRGRAA
jgi:hypothetical protein